MNSLTDTYCLLFTIYVATARYEPRSLQIQILYGDYLIILMVCKMRKVSVMILSCNKKIISDLRNETISTMGNTLKSEDRFQFMGLRRRRLG